MTCRASGALSAIVFFLLSAGAQAQTVAPPPMVMAASPPPMVVTAPPPPRDDLGGGFIQFLFGGEQTRQRVIAPPPTAAAPPSAAYVAPSPAARTVYASAAPVDPVLERHLPGFHLDPRYLPQEVAYRGKEDSGTIVIDTPDRFLYLVQNDGHALRYGIGVGRPGFTWAGDYKISAKKEWPDWVPPKEMLERQPYLPHFMSGGPHNPLGARALYIGSTLYRIHGTAEPWTIGHNVSSGCIRMRNVDVIDLYNRVKVGAKVEVL